MAQPVSPSQLSPPQHSFRQTNPFHPTDPSHTSISIPNLGIQPPIYHPHPSHIYMANPNPIPVFIQTNPFSRSAPLVHPPPSTPPDSQLFAFGYSLDLQGV